MTSCTTEASRGQRIDFLPPALQRSVGCVTIVAIVLVGWPAPGAALCGGDCDGSGQVTVDELQVGATIALGAASIGDCSSLDGNGDGTVTVDELLAAVSAALEGCPAPPLTPTPVGPGCGDGITNGQEECDDGNRQDGDGCSANCTLEPNGDLCTGIAAHSGTRLATALVAAGLSTPLYLTAEPRDVARLFIVEQTGRIRIVKWGTLLDDPFVDLSARVSCCGERGLLSMAFHPNYAANGQVFVDYTDTAGNTVVARFRVSTDPDRLDADSEEVIFRQQQPFPNHNGGLVLFGPDGYLYVGLGDGGSAGDPQGNGQSLHTWLGKLLRIDVNGGPPYSIPADNPLVAPPERLPKSGRSVCATRGASASIAPRATCTSPTSDRACMRRSTCNRPGAAVTTTGGTSRRGYIAFGRPPAVQWMGSHCR